MEHEGYREQENTDYSIKEIDGLLRDLDADEIEAWATELKNSASDKYERLDNSFRAIFDRLNLYNVNELLSFDIPINDPDIGDPEELMRIQRTSDSMYYSSYVKRENGRTSTPEGLNRLGGTYTYYFGTNNENKVEIRLSRQSELDDTQDDDGEVSPRPKDENGILIKALSLDILPTMEVTEARLAQLWQSIHQIETESTN